MPAEGSIHIIDDDEAVRESLDFLFDSAGLAVRIHESAPAFLETLDPMRTSCIVTDIRMPDMSGMELLRELRARGVEAPVIVITGHGDVPLAVEAMRAGAYDFLEKPFDDERLLDVVRAAVESRTASHGTNEQTAARAKVARLSQRERQVLKGLIEGRLNKTIAFDLGISARTVEVYRAKLMAKMEANAFADLVRMALLAGDLDV